MSSDTPDYWTKQVTLRDGTKLKLRPEKPSGLPMLKNMFLTLSDETTKHLDTPFTEERIEKLISNLNYEKTLPILAIIKLKSNERIISVASPSMPSILSIDRIPNRNLILSRNKNSLPPSEKHRE